MDLSLKSFSVLYFGALYHEKVTYWKRSFDKSLRSRYSHQWKNKVQITQQFLLPDFDCGATEWHELNDCRWDIDWCNCSGTVYTALLVLRSIALAWFSLLLRTVDSTRTQYVQFVLCIVIDNYTANVKATSWTIRLVKHAESPCANQVLMKLLKAFIVETDKRMYTFLPFS